jgi:uncharacterized protein (DUF58 family)
MMKKQSTGNTSSARFLSPDILSRIGSLELLARTVVEGFISGLHQSPYIGFSVDFVEYRPYTPGDDIRYLDWKLLARTDRYYVKKFQGDTNTRVHLLVDVSGSMNYGSTGLTKLEYASYLAASLAYLVSRQQDAVGLVSFDQAVLEYIPPRMRPRHLHLILSALEKTKPGRESAISTVLGHVAELFDKRGIIVLISDLYEDSGLLGDALKLLRFKGNDVIVFHLLDETELNFPFADPAAFEDLETGEDLHVAPDELRLEYQRALNSHVEALRQTCGANRIDYQVMNTSAPLDHALFAYLSRRSHSA